MQKPWTQQEVDTLLSLKDALGPTAIGKQLDRSCDSVRKKLKALGFTVVKHVPESVEEAPDSQEVAKKVGTELCPNCRVAVSEWDAHVARMGQFVCERAA